ncbi:acetate--CoA ligase family protein [Leptospira interrogans]
MINRLLRPKSIAIVGASETEGSFGQRLLSSIRGAGFDGSIFPINPKYGTIDGIPSYPTLSAIGRPVDLVAFAVAEERLLPAFEDAAKAGAGAAVIFSRGYVAPDAPRPSIGERWVALAREAGMSVCGDNCMGFINFVDKVRVSGNPPPVPLDAGRIALLSHSGSTWSGMLGNQRQLKFNYALSVGRESVTTMADYIEFLLDHTDTKVIGLVMETFRSPEKLMTGLARAQAKGVPIVALKLGRSERGQRFTRSHSGAIAGSDAACQALFDAYNVARTYTLDEFADTLEIMQSSRKPAAPSIAVGTDSGGERQLISDIGADVGIRFADFTDETTRRLEAILDPGLEAANPLDYWGDGRMYWAECLQIMSEDPGVGSVVMATNMVSGRKILKIAGESVQALHQASQKPIVMMGNLHSTIDREEAARLRAFGIPVLMGTSTGLSALKHFSRYHHPEDYSRDEVPKSPDATIVARWRDRLTTGDPLGPAETEELLTAFRIPMVSSRFVENEAAALAAAERLGYPVVLKTARSDILHKTDVGGVLLNIGVSETLVDGYRKLASAFGPSMQIQKMAKPGTELLLGMTSDPQLGPLITVGLGGIFVEVYKDVVAMLPPVGPQRVLDALHRLKAFPLLQGNRGKPPADLKAIAEVVSRFSLMVHLLKPHLLEADVNPLIARPDGILAVDALLIGSNASRTDPQSREATP